MVKERGILFTGPMVRAILSGQKTQTRRIIKPQPVFDGFFWSHKKYAATEKAFRSGMACFGHCKYGVKGDRLYVRETWGPCNSKYEQDIATATYACFPDGSQKFKLGTYFEDDKNPDDIADKWPAGWKWRSSIHMPRWASRITLEVAGVRVERVQEISEADAFAEGVDMQSRPALINGELGTYHPMQPSYEYARLWNAINGEGSWSANPWVWVIEFKRIDTSTN